MLYPTYAVNDVPMLDPKGRWHEHERMRVLPAHPGLKVTSVPQFGVGGERVLPQLPHESGEFILHMVVNAVDLNGVRARNPSDRLVQLHDNANALFLALGIARQSQGFPARLERRLTAFRSLTTHGYLAATSEPQYDPGMDYAEYQFIFRLPDALWRGWFFYERFFGTGSHNIEQLAGSTAVIDGPLVIAAGPMSSLQVVNVAGNGFRLDFATPLGISQCVAINTKTWSVSPVYQLENTAEPTPPAVPYIYGAGMQTVGATSGVALSLLPEADGAKLTVSGTGWTADSSIYIHTSEAFF